MNFASLQRQQTPKRKVRWKDFSIRGRTLQSTKERKWISRWKNSHYSRELLSLIIFSQSRQPKSFPVSSVCVGDIYLSWWHTLVLWHFQLPDLKRQFIRFHRRHSHTYIPAHLYTLLPILAASHRLELLSFFFFFFSLLVGALEELPRKCNSDELKFFLFPQNVCHAISFCCYFMHRFRRYYN